MNRGKQSSEQGQTLVLVVIGFFIFVAMLALVLDGGNAYAAKRSAQNAADAGALAGAQYMCEHRNEVGVVTAAEAKAVEYATLNGANEPAPDVDIDFTNATVMVTATVTKDTFFAGLIGFDQVAPLANAAAQCKPPGVGVLPVAWSCRENVVGEVSCTENIGPCRDAGDPQGLDCTFMLMDSVKVKGGGGPCDPDETDPTDPKYCYQEIGDGDIVCFEPSPPSCDQDPAEGLIDCDLNNDCVNDLMTGGARSWLDLDGGGGGANELKDWISGSVVPPEVDVHQWVPEESGVATSIFHTTAEFMVGNDVILPVFDKLCDGLPTIDEPESLAQCNAGAIDDQTLATNGSTNFHIISFSAFHVTCVQTTKNKSVSEAGYQLSPSHKTCYGHDRAVSAGSIDDNDKTIEGYFVRKNLGGYGGPGDWYDTGTFTVILIK